MRTIAEQITFIKDHKQIGLMTHVVAGYPSLATTEELVMMMETAGVDFIEIQIPFSDPIADGPTIMKANDKALENKVTTADVLKLMEKLAKKVEIPLLFMGYYNSLFQYGVKKFCQEAEQAGAKGLIIPDVPLDEEKNEHFLKYANQHKLAAIRVLSPSSTDTRIADNVKVAQGFIYCTAVSGITGTHNTLDLQTSAFLQRMKKVTDIPLAVGFGISKPEHIKALIGYADIAVVGSAVIQVIEQKGVKAAVEYVSSLVKAGR